MQVVCAGAAAAVSQGALRGGKAGRQHQRARRGLHGAADLRVHPSTILVLSHLRQDLHIVNITGCLWPWGPLSASGYCSVSAMDKAVQIGSFLCARQTA